MFCQECNSKSATVHMTKIIQGQKEEIHLCEECAMKKETINFENPFSIHNFLAGLLDMNGDPQFKQQYSAGIKCSQCGKSYNEFRKVGKLSCDHCYESFGEQLKPLIRKIHGNIHHTGKIPKRTGSIIKIKREINQLKNQLKKTIEQEAFEKAAELRDEIKGLEKKMEGM